MIIGGVVGWLASIAMKTNAQMGLVANVGVGVVGSLLGFWAAGLVGIAPTGGILRFIVAPQQKRFGRTPRVRWIF